jgi:putative hydrolase of the HAD superfamily
MLNATSLIESCETVAFDCAGTLLRLDPPQEVIFREAAAELGVNLRLESVASAYVLVNFSLKMKSSELSSTAAKIEFYRVFNAQLCAALGIQRSFERLHPLLMRRFTERRQWTAFDDVIETLQAIGQHVPVHVLANWNTGLDDVLRRAGLRDLFGDVAASESLGIEKPARECFEAFIARNGLNPARVVYVGNEYVADVVGAREAGLTPVLVDRDDRLPAADCPRVRSLRDLIPDNWEASRESHILWSPEK